MTTKLKKLLDDYSDTLLSLRKFIGVLFSFPAVLAVCGVTFTFSPSMQAFAENVGVASEDAKPVRETLDKMQHTMSEQKLQTEAIQRQLEMMRDTMMLLHAPAPAHVDNATEQE